MTAQQQLSHGWAMMARVSPRPAPRPIDRWEKAEENSAAWMRHWGYRDAQVTPPGSDRGIDVQAGAALAQVKWTGKPMGRDAVQKLFGARGQRHEKTLLFFTGPGHGYSQPALEDANRLGVALFRYDIQGAMTPVNGSARRILQGAAASVPSTAASRQPTHAPPAAGGVQSLVLVIAVFSTVIAAGAVAGFVDSGGRPDLAGTRLDIAGVSGLLAVAFWGIWLSRRSTTPAAPAHRKAGPDLPCVPIFDGDRKPVDRVLTEKESMKRPLTDGEWMHDPGDDLSFDYHKPVAAVVEALVAIHATGGGLQPGIDDQNRRVTIAPNWVQEYTGLVSITADLEAFTVGVDSVTRVRWLTHSKATPATLEEATEDGHAAAERANNILAHLLGR
ncbi:restriction endonuclease [Nocardioides sp. P5_E3]